MHPSLWHGKIGQHHFDALRINFYAGTRFHHLLDGFHGGPQACVAAHGEGVYAHVQNLLHTGWEEHGHARCLENMVALVGGRRAFADVVIACYRNHAPPFSGARHIGVLEDVYRTVYTWTFAVPNAEYAIVFVVFFGRVAQHLGAPDGGGTQLFVHAWLKDNMVLI